MAEDILYPLITTPSSRTTERKKRKDSYVRETLTHSQADALIDKGGWELDKKHKYKTRIKREKSIDEELENRFWLLLDALGFSELNQGRKFQVKFVRRGNVEGVKQIDVFAKDDETVIVAECKACSELRKRSLQKDIEEFSNLKKPIADAIRKHYGNNFKPKIIWAIVTDKIIWSTPDKDRATGEQIAVVTERELRYFLELAKHLGPAGRYQFLAHFLEGQKVPGLENRSVPAIRGKLGGRTFYSFVTTPDRLLKIAFVNHRTLNDPKGMPTYQRLINKKRIKDIGNFIEKGGFFPTNIIVNFRDKARFDTIKKEDEAGIHFGLLHFPEKYKSAYVIDGQHRLYGFSGLEHHQASDNVLVLAFEKMDFEDEADLFVTINHEQKSVPRTLLADLQGELHWDSDNPRQRLTAIASRLVNTLGSDPSSPFHERIVQTGLRGSRETCLTLPQLEEALRRSGLLGSVSQKLKAYQSGPFTGKDDYETLDRARNCLDDIFGLLAEANPKAWRAGQDGGICTNAGVGGLFFVISEAIRDYENDTRNEVKELDTTEISLFLQDYVTPIIDEIKTLDAKGVSRLFKEDVPYGSKAPQEVFLKLVRIIRRNYPEFGPPIFETWLAEQNTERLNEASAKVQELNQLVCNAIFNKFRQIYGESQYWERGVTNKDMKTDAYARSQDVDPDERGPLEEYLFFIEYRKIVEKKENWDHFKAIFDIPLPGEKGQAKNLKWMDKINDIRKKTTHQSTNRRLTDAEVNIVDFVHAKFINQISAADHNESE
ncbi:DGQHR domain-containing protein [Parvularcula flava]|uniref:DGQHR domain-containing protein n=1 Tax=Aquisalinus luteolus TaxID=1566827 RepID=A0A8J3A1A4_9PROT|nr:DGQHR domain-containing protein [Aquisalinus luteolus]NHK26519.1 DGQHR domain-containing protein [Aquisalinus luteolus]GGH92586.1 hypothetical protein GCM10011355_02430 [Aquisalinus luteolus]